MEQRDLIKDKIEQLGKVLARIISDFLGLKSKGQFAQGIEISNERFQSELNIDIEKIIRFDKTETKEYFNHRKLAAPHLEVLSEYFIEIGMGKLEANKAGAELYLKKAIELFDIVDKTSKTLSLERINKKTQIENLIKEQSSFGN